MVKLDGILNKLNIMERTQLSNYIKVEMVKQGTAMKQALNEAAKEREDFLLKQNDTTWNVINDNITLALKENRISDERINKVYKRLYELTNNNPDIRLMDIPEQPSRDFEILTKDEYRDLIEELLEGHCKGCIKHNKNCNVYKLMKKHNIPYSGMKGKCKYAY